MVMAKIQELNLLELTDKTNVNPHLMTLLNCHTLNRGENKFSNETWCWFFLLFLLPLQYKKNHTRN